MAIGKKSKNQVEKVRPVVYDRDLHRCVVEDSVMSWRFPCGGGLTIQHAFRRGLGSSAMFDDADCLRTMCAIHNQLAESSAPFASYCVKMGWSAPRWVHERGYTRILPVWYPDGWHLLQNSERIRISQKTADDCREEIYGKEENDLGQSRR
jgi:hypothetical protein